MPIIADSPLTISLLDKLIDASPEKTSDISYQYHELNEIFFESIRRDLEILLNTRASIDKPKSNYVELNQSVLTFGTPDIMNHYLDDENGLSELCKVLERQISLFEPRLQQVKVRMNIEQERDRALRLRIDANLGHEMQKWSVVFDSIMQPHHNRITVNKSFNH